MNKLKYFLKERWSPRPIHSDQPSTPQPAETTVEPVAVELPRIGKLLAAYQIDTVLDVGANQGQFAQRIRQAGYKGLIISYEPLSSAFRNLAQTASHDQNWDVQNFALADFDGKAEINIAGNSYSSSFLDMLPRHLESAPESKYVGKEWVVCKKLDSIIDNVPGDHIFLKMDVQGFEKRILDGGPKALGRIHSIQLEMLLAPLYKDALEFSDMLNLMMGMGYTLVGLEPDFSDPVTGQLLAVDGIFHRS